MTKQEQLIRNVRLSATAAMAIAVFLMCGHEFLGWFAFGDRGFVWYYPTVIAFQVFFILAQIWINRAQRDAS